jgi:hypothetical protein
LLYNKFVIEKIFCGGVKLMKEKKVYFLGLHLDDKNEVISGRSTIGTETNTNMYFTGKLNTDVLPLWLRFLLNTTVKTLCKYLEKNVFIKNDKGVG